MSVRPKLCIGVDFDNTLVDYGPVFLKYALREGWVRPGTAASKNAVRAAVREARGNDAWTELQRIVYSRAVGEALPCPGSIPFLSWARSERYPVYVVSHKTAKAASDGVTDLRAPAAAWLSEQGFSPQTVFFEETLEAKVTRIGVLECTHFVDDLPDVLHHPSFPAKTEKILYARDGENGRLDGLRIFSEWDAITVYLRGCGA